jgi:hypothetical protein
MSDSEVESVNTEAFVEFLKNLHDEVTIKEQEFKIIRPRGRPATMTPEQRKENLRAYHRERTKKKYAEDEEYKARRLEATKRYHEANKEKKKAKEKEYYEAHKEELKEGVKKRNIQKYNEAKEAIEFKKKYEHLIKEKDNIV